MGDLIPEPTYAELHDENLEAFKRISRLEATHRRRFDELSEKDAKIAELENEITALKRLLNAVTKAVGKLHEALADFKSAGRGGMTPEERATKIFLDERKIAHSSNPGDYIKLYKKHIEQARSEALEEAAKVVDNDGFFFTDLASQNEVAREIRTLKGKGVK